MKIFVTGASGYIGHSVAKTFRAKGHTVYGLIRTQENEDCLIKSEIIPVIGNLNDPQSYHNALSQCEVAVLCAFEPNEKGVENDLKTIEFVIESFKTTGLSRTVIYTSGVWVYGSKGDSIANEASSLNPIPLVQWRPEHEKKVIQSSSSLLKTVVIRPGVVYGLRGSGMTGLLFKSASEGQIALAGNGCNRWPMIHVQDLAYAYVSAAEKEINGVVLNVTDDSCFTLNEIGNAIARYCRLENGIKYLSDQEAQQKYNALVQGMTIDLKIDNSRVKRLLGWQIHHTSFINELPFYFEAWQYSQKIAIF